MRTRGKHEALWFWAGMAVMALTLVPNLILGEDAIFAYHDQLDGEMIGYILQARHLFSGDVLPEFMGGASKTALTMPAPICVLLFLGESPLGALTVMQLAGRLAGFAGMYLLSRELTGHAWIGSMAGILYGLLPFLPVYGLSQYGIPLLFWCALQLRKGKHLIFSYCYTAFFGLASSLVLAGFGLLGLGAAFFVMDLWRRRRPWHFLAAWQLLLCVYIAENWRLLVQFLGIGDGFVSHKAEYAINARPFWDTLVQGISAGAQSGEGYHGLLIPAVLGAVTIALAVFRVQEKGKSGAGDPAVWPVCVRSLRYMGCCAGWNLLFALLAALWESSVLAGLRRSMGAIGAFQIDRILWMAPCFWYLMSACGIAILWELWAGYKGRRWLLAGGCLMLAGIAAGITGIRILLAGDIKSNVQKLRDPEYSILSYRDYYGIGVMEQVRDFLTEQTGTGQDGYRVVSLGIDPAAALYHGFYCLDGYSNNYSLDYKHKFRKVLGPELEKSEYLRIYFDQWGNRCYLFSSECPGYVTIKKHGFFFQDYQLDTDALREMGCDWLLSAAYILNAESQGLELMNETPFETEGSYYGIYVYKVGEGGKD